MLKDFKGIDLDHDGYIQFLEFLRTLCNRQGVHMPASLSLADTLQIYQAIEWRHITAADRKSLVNELEEIQHQIDPSLAGRKWALWGLTALTAVTAAFLVGKHLK